MTDTTIKTNSSLLTRNNVFPQSTVARLRSHCELLEANSETLTARGLLPAIAAKLGIAA